MFAPIATEAPLPLSWQSWAPNVYASTWTIGRTDGHTGERDDGPANEGKSSRAQDRRSESVLILNEVPISPRWNQSSKPMMGRTNWRKEEMMMMKVWRIY